MSILLARRLNERGGSDGLSPWSSPNRCWKNRDGENTNEQQASQRRGYCPARLSRSVYPRTRQRHAPSARSWERTIWPSPSLMAVLKEERFHGSIMSGLFANFP